MKTIANYPELVSQWHPIKNGSLKPSDVSFGSHKRCWWKCPIADDHEWEAVAISRARNGTGCPCCAGQKTVISNCLATTHPELIERWHPIKNGLLKPTDITAGNHRKVWWKCPIADDHEWEASLNNRTKTIPTDCPCCAGKKVVKSNCLWATHREVAKEWHPTKNGTLTAFDVVAGARDKIWWKCITYDHEWETVVSARTRTNGNANGCPMCNSSKGEQLVAGILSRKPIVFKRQYKISSCKNKLPLPFDFAIFHEKQLALIEYQGEHHYEPVYYGEKTYFQDVKKRDQIKKEWCNRNNILLLEIPYWERNNAEKLINEFLDKLAEK